MSKKMKLLGATVALLAVCICGSAFAWLTDYEYKDDGVFTVGKVDIVLTGVDSDGVVTPLEDLDVNPVITLATGSEAAYVFAEVTIPKVASGKTISFDEDDGEYVLSDATGKEVADLVTDDGWELIVTDPYGPSAAAVTRVYAHKEILESGESTDALYSSSEVLNFAYEEANHSSANGDPQLPSLGTTKVEVKAYGIQAAGMTEPTNADGYKKIYNSAYGQHHAIVD